MVQLFKECTRNVNKVIEFFSTTVETEFHYMRIAQRNYKVHKFRVETSTVGVVFLHEQKQRPNDYCNCKEPQNFPTQLFANTRNYLMVNIPSPSKNVLPTYYSFAPHSKFAKV